MIELFRSIQLVEVWFDTVDEKRIRLPRITQPEPEQPSHPRSDQVDTAQAAASPNLFPREGSGKNRSTVIPET